MAKVKVYAPNTAFSGAVAGVVFADGVGEADEKQDAGALAYFKRQGYGIGKKAPRVTPETPATDARDIARTGPHVVGTPLRDAAVDPRPEDFLPPVNAGEADPHGPLVVAPEIHHDGPKGLKPGPVHVGDPERQNADERALAEAVLIDGELKTEAVPAAAPEAGGAPAKSASQKAWAAWAVSQGMDPGEADAATRADLIARYGGES